MYSLHHYHFFLDKWSYEICIGFEFEEGSYVSTPEVQHGALDRGAVCAIAVNCLMGS